MGWLDDVDRWAADFRAKHGVDPEDALFRLILRKPLRVALVALSLIATPPFLFGCAVGAALHHFWP